MDWIKMINIYGTITVWGIAQPVSVETDKLIAIATFDYSLTAPTKGHITSTEAIQCQFINHM
jgi:hypothetical protein